MPGLGRFPRGGNGNPLQYSCLENPMDRGVWWAPADGVSESDVTEQLSAHIRVISSALYIFWLVPNMVPAKPSVILKCFLNIYLFIWLCYVLDREYWISHCSVLLSSYVAWSQLPHVIQDLSSLTGDQTPITCIGKWILNHWTTREAPKSSVLIKDFCLETIKSSIIFTLNIKPRGEKKEWYNHGAKCYVLSPFYGAQNSHESLMIH